MIIHAGDNLQAALDAAAPGEVLELESGATFTGNYVARGAEKTLTGAATLRSLNNLPALRTEAHAARWRFADVSFAVGASSGDIVQLGDGLIADAALLPRQFVFERCAFAADQTAKRGLELNAADVTLRDCTISGVKLAGQESQAICCWNGPGPFVIEDCHIEAGSIGVLFGGAAPAIPNLVPSDITFRRNTVTRPLAMRGQNWAVKNLFELKNARRVVATGNLFEHNWPQGQAGFAIVLTVRANGNAPWSIVEDVRFESNIVRRSAMGFNVLGQDYTALSQVMRNVVVRNNLVYEIDHTVWGGNGAFVLIGGAPVDLHIEQNTVWHSGNVIGVSGQPCAGFRYMGNLSKHNSYGIFGNAIGTGNPAIAQYFPGAVITGNVLAGGPVTLYSGSPGNLFPTVAALEGNFLDRAAADYRLVPFSPYEGTGCDQDAIEAARLPPPPPPPEPTLEETIQAEAELAQAGVSHFGGTWSPQDAAFEAIGRYRDALLSALGLS